MEELKKCPFCGGEANIIQTQCLENNFVGYQVFHLCRYFDLPIQTSIYEKIEYAIKTWNRRME